MGKRVADMTAAELERERARRRARREANRDKERACNLAWREANRDKERAYNRARREANRDKVRACNRAWREANRDKERARNRARFHKRRASCKTSVGLAPTAAQLSAILKDPCLYCGDPAEHVDHFIPLARGGMHTLDNLVPACAACNLSKGAKLPDVEWTGRKRSG